MIIEAASKKAYPSLTAFQAAVLANRCEISDGQLVYEGLDGSGTLTLYLSGERLPEADGAAVNLDLPKTFDSPFLQEEYGSGVVTITKGSRRLLIDVSRVAGAHAGSTDTASRHNTCNRFDIPRIQN